MSERQHPNTDLDEPQDCSLSHANEPDATSTQRDRLRAAERLTVRQDRIPRDGTKKKGAATVQTGMQPPPLWSGERTTDTEPGTTSTERFPETETTTETDQLSARSLLDPYKESCGDEKNAENAPHQPTDITCPRQTTTSFWDTNTGLHHLIRVVCKTWACPYCGPIKRATLAADVKRAKPNRFITLTTAGHSAASPREVFDATRRQLSELAKVLRRDHGEFEYLRCLEQHKSGYPHYHLIVRSPYLAKHELSRHWQHFTGAYIVDVRKVSDDDRSVKYIMKYLGKQDAVTFTTRRLSWTKNFFPPREKQPPSEIHAIDVLHWRASLEDVVYWEMPNTTWIKVNRWHWIQTKNADHERNGFQPRKA